MSRRFINEQTLTDIADAVRLKLGNSTLYKPSEMAAAINGIVTGGTVLSGTSAPTAELGINGDIYVLYNGEKSYLRNTAYTYIDTGYSPTLNTKIVCECNIRGGSDYACPFGARDSVVTNASSGPIVVFKDGNNFDYAFGTNLAALSGCAFSSITNKDIRITLENGFVEVYVDSEHVYATTFTPGNYVTNYSLYIYNFDQKGEPHNSAYCNMDLYDMKIYESDTLVHHYIPAIYEDVACLCDTETDGHLYDAYTNTSGAKLTARINGEITAVYIKINGTWTSMLGAQITTVIPS